MPFKFGVDSSGNYGYIKDGADTVTPFKGGSYDTPGTATAAHITEGYTAWVNGEFITGTRPAPVISQTGSFNTGTIPNLNERTYQVTFTYKFEIVPKIKLSSSNNHISVGAYNITETGFSVRAFKDSADTGGFTATVYWTATVEM